VILEARYWNFCARGLHCFVIFASRKGSLCPLDTYTVLDRFDLWVVVAKEDADVGGLPTSFHNTEHFTGRKTGRGPPTIALYVFLMNGIGIAARAGNDNLIPGHFILTLLLLLLLLLVSADSRGLACIRP
jgi:hypothetical protein